MDRLKINGVERDFPDGLPQTIDELLQKLNLSKDTVVAELDSRIIERQNFSSTSLKSGQSIELIRLMPGG
jgi:sulfur carrier protein